MTISLFYDDVELENESDVVMMHYSATEGWGYAGKADQNESANTVSIQTRQFSTYVPVIPIGPTPLNAASAFDPTVHRWPMKNFAGPFFSFQPDFPAHCFGMTAHALWFWRNVSARLADTYDTDAIASSFSVAELAAMQAQFAEQGLWDYMVGRNPPILLGATIPPQAFVATDLRAQIGILHSPVLLVLFERQPGGPGTQRGAQHSVIAYGYQGDTFQIWDPDFPQPTSLVYSPTQRAFEPYRSLLNFLVPLPAATFWAKTSDHYLVWQAATANPSFGASQAIQVVFHGPGEIVRSAKPTLNLSLDLGGTRAAGFVFSEARDAFAAFDEGVNRPQAVEWVPPHEGKNTLIFLAISLGRVPRWLAQRPA